MKWRRSPPESRDEQFLANTAPPSDTEMEKFLDYVQGPGRRRRWSELFVGQPGSARGARDGRLKGGPDCLPGRFTAAVPSGKRRRCRAKPSSISFLVSL